MVGRRFFPFGAHGLFSGANMLVFREDVVCRGSTAAIVENEGLQGFAIKNVIVLVLTVAGQG